MNIEIYQNAGDELFQFLTQRIHEALTDRIKGEITHQVRQILIKHGLEDIQMRLQFIDITGTINFQGNRLIDKYALKGLMEEGYQESLKRVKPIT